MQEHKKNIVIAPKGRISFPDLPKKSEEFDKGKKWEWGCDISARPEHINGRNGIFFIDEMSFYPGLQYLNYMLYDDMFHNMRMCRKLREFLKPVVPSYDLQTSACYPMGIPEPPVYWTPWEQIADDMFKRDKAINAINRAYRNYQFNINSTYGKLR